ncbi:hypothetical protein CH373_15125 [Leptospira perolatii]|uniref:DUF202 domain-containing protein n=1 Tax=Leptospira perolatii TaxID=2023191 RepID=A0A2M9ZJM7_9LEPT|nr:hypothetical protein [Leptospira perolatii]PJZ69430.1 hypothetical protein CH360_10465 [Leptospira perolatii]PJZ72255.1 hypothetical protein CH373_15125 [Leptospira perolatii]
MESTEFSREQHRELDSLRAYLRNIAIIFFLLSGPIFFSAVFAELPGKIALLGCLGTFSLILGVLSYSASLSFRRSLDLEGSDPEQLLYALKDLRTFLLWLGWTLLGFFLLSFAGAIATLFT